MPGPGLSPLIISPPAHPGIDPFRIHLTTGSFSIDLMVERENTPENENQALFFNQTNPLDNGSLYFLRLLPG